MCLVWSLGTMLMQDTAVDETIEMSLAMQFFSERDKVMGLLCMGLLVLCV